MVRVAVDAMGGDHAPEEIVAGAALAHKEGLARILLVGQRERIEPLLCQHGVDGEIEVVHAPEAIAMDAGPSQVLRNSDATSLGTAVNLVRDAKADAVVSAGNSGAFLAIALIRLRTIQGIARPAIAVVLPGKRSPVVLLDAGANVDCKPEWLAQFGIMGSAYARGVLGIAEPRVGIISVGEERAKGNTQAIDAARCLDQAPVQFIGNVESKDLFSSFADVVVTDGFVGNVILKLCEGLPHALGDIVVEEIHAGGPLTKLGALLVRPALRNVKKKIAYETYGGAPLLGLRGTCIVAHGRANCQALRSAVAAAAVAVREDIVGRIAAAVVVEKAV
jgi:glycerol-3-phosphate acyltransferase PlsX